MGLLGLCILAALLSPIASAQNILNDTTHIYFRAIETISALGGTGIVDANCKFGFAVNMNPTEPVDPAGCDFYNSSTGELIVGGNVINPPAVIAAAANTSQVEYQPGTANSTGTPNPDAPYAIVNESAAGYNIRFDQQNYAALEADNIIYSMGYCGTPGAGDYPPIAFTTVLPNIIAAGAVNTGECGYAQGIEFSIPVDPGPFASCVQPANPANESQCTWTPFPGAPALDAESPSSTTELLSGTLSVLKQNHPSLTWGDIKGALRQTASCWGTGYAASCGSGSAIGFGYGNINFVAANAISAPSSIFLQPPGMQIGSTVVVGNNQFMLTFTLYPFLQTRRVMEAVYLGGTWPAPATGCGGTCNEFTAAQIAAAGATLFCTSTGMSCSNMLAGPPPPQQGTATETLTFVALTLDANGNGSRVESFMPQSLMLTSQAPPPPPPPQPVLTGQEAALTLLTVLSPVVLP
jgi:hypothetical protein